MGKVGIVGVSVAWAWAEVGVGCWSVVSGPHPPEPLEPGSQGITCSGGLQGGVHGAQVMCKCGFWTCPRFQGRFMVIPHKPPNVMTHFLPEAAGALKPKSQPSS